MPYAGYIITGLIAFVFGVLVTQLALHVNKVKRENSCDEQPDSVELHIDWIADFCVVGHCCAACCADDKGKDDVPAFFPFFGDGELPPERFVLDCLRHAETGYAHAHCGQRDCGMLRYPAFVGGPGYDIAQ